MYRIKSLSPFYSFVNDRYTGINIARVKKILLQNTSGAGIIAISVPARRIAVVRGERCAIESHRAVAVAAVGRDDWVILKIVDGNDAGAIIKSRSMPRQS